MKRSTKITSIIIIFFLIIATVIIGRQMIGMHFQKKFSKRPLPGIIVTTVEEQNFVNKIDSFGTATPSKTKSFNLQKHEILTSIDFNKKVKKGEIIAKLKSTNILAPFDGVVGKRDFSNDIKVSESSIVINIEDTSILFVDLDLPEIYVSVTFFMHFSVLGCNCKDPWIKKLKAERIALPYHPASGVRNSKEPRGMKCIIETVILSRHRTRISSGISMGMADDLAFPVVYS